MAQAAVESALNGDSLIGRQQGVVPRMKRKTPSELRVMPFDFSFSCPVVLALFSYLGVGMKCLVRHKCYFKRYPSRLLHNRKY
jgi:hypothetical protein